MIRSPITKCAPCLTPGIGVPRPSGIRVLSEDRKLEAQSLSIGRASEEVGNDSSRAGFCL